MEEGEVGRHFLLRCSAFTRLKLKHIDSRIIGVGDELAGIDISQLDNVVAGGKHFVDC